MSEISRAKLFGKLNPIGYKAIEGGTANCKLRGNPYVELEHWLQQLLQVPDSDLHRIINYFELDRQKLAADLQTALERLPRGATSISDLSANVEDATERGWVYATLMFDDTTIRTSHLLVGLLKTTSLRRCLNNISHEFSKIAIDALTDNLSRIVSGSPEERSPFADTPQRGDNYDAQSAVDSTPVFLCYRRSDTMHVAGRLYDRLAAEFGRDRIFKDVNSIPLGLRDFSEEVRNRLARARFFLPLIGNNWVEAVDSDGGKRLEDPEDHVRTEIELALQSDAQIIPILVDTPNMPPAKKFPESIRRLARCPALKLRGDPDFERDVGDLILHLRRSLNS